MAERGVSLSWGGLDKAMSGAARALSEGRKALLAEIGEALVSGTLERFQAEKGPDGTAWKKKAGSGKTLTDTGRLRASIDSAVTSDAVMVGSNLEYARIHQLGGEIRPKKGKYLKFKGQGGRDVFVKKAILPARPYLGVSDEDKDEIAAIIGEHLKKGFLGT